MSWASMCFECGGRIPHDPPDDPIGSLSCTDCPHCGNHRCGALQQQAGRPCAKEAA